MRVSLVSLIFGFCLGVLLTNTSFSQWTDEIAAKYVLACRSKILKNDEHYAGAALQAAYSKQSGAYDASVQSVVTATPRNGENFDAKKVTLRLSIHVGKGELVEFRVDSCGRVTDFEIPEAYSTKRVQSD